MRVLVACEFSGRVRDAFLARGHDAVSCDLLPTDSPGPHIVGDALEVTARESFDLIVAHPPCTYLTNSGVRWLHTEPGRWDKMRHGAEFFRALLDTEAAPRVAVENPIMHRYAREIVGRRADQLVQPWWFGHPETKATGLWLRGLPPLVETHNVRAEMQALTVAERNRVHYASPGPDRWKLRSLTYAGLAAAMADQWGGEGAE